MSMNKEVFLTLLQILRQNNFEQLEFGPENYLWIRESTDSLSNTYICIYDGKDISRFKSYVGHKTIINNAVEYLIAQTDEGQYASDDSTDNPDLSDSIGVLLVGVDTSGKLWETFQKVYKDLFETKSQDILEKL